MRLIFLISALMVLTRCSEISASQANDGQSPSSLMGSQGGGGVQTSIWSDDPNKKTLTNEHPQ